MKLNQTRLFLTLIFIWLSGDILFAGHGVSGFATYYTVTSSGPRTASGQRYNEAAMTCALPIKTRKAWNMKFGQRVRVTNQANGRTVILTYLDTGPAVWTGNKIDLTPAAFQKLAKLKQGRIKVRIEKI